VALCSFRLWHLTDLRTAIARLAMHSRAFRRSWSTLTKKYSQSLFHLLLSCHLMAADRLAQTLTEMHALFESALNLDRSVCSCSADRHTLPMKGVF
jgi:hypothetical protein